MIMIIESFVSNQFYNVLKSANIQIIINVARTEIHRIILNNKISTILLIERIFQSFHQICIWNFLVSIPLLFKSKMNYSNAYYLVFNMF